MIQEVKKTLPFRRSFSHTDAPGHFAGAVVQSGVSQDAWFMFRAIPHPDCPCNDKTGKSAFAHLKYQADYVSKDGVGFDPQKHELLFETAEEQMPGMPVLPEE